MNTQNSCHLIGVLGFAALLLGCNLTAGERTEHFDQDPKWHEHNNRSVTPEPREIRQDFGYSTTMKCGGSTPGEIGGFINPAAETAYYAKAIPEKSFADALTASGKLVCEGRQFHVLVAFFNAATTNEWRTPNSIAIRLQGRGVSRRFRLMKSSDTPRCAANLGVVVFSRYEASHVAVHTMWLECFLRTAPRTRCRHTCANR